MKNGRCEEYDDEDVLAWVLGDVDEAEEQGLTAHLASCSSCLERAAEYRALEHSADACRTGPVIRWRGFKTPFGTVRIAASRDGLIDLSWQMPSDDEFIARLERRHSETPVVCDCDELEPAEEQLCEYFDRERRSFDLPIDLSALTPFQQEVLDATARLGFGEVATYAEIAERVGRPAASRAVGNALGQNPVAIIVPCHRVVRTDGTLGGYTGGLRYKKVLLDIEGRRDLLPTAEQPPLF
ncbi:MAG: methylated-DNA--[protein]-cysteine S-methyltransferase [Gemmatimonadetes bacterium]|nr:methylated-DNA--[protein]-cysteine S-methyltransferase [Gemmatimonadota bacterium]